MKTLSFYLIAIFLFFSCQAPLNIGGKYSSRKDLHKLELLPDSTFIYTSSCYGSSVINKYSDGKWSYIDKNTVVLNSRITNNIIPLQVERVSASDSTIQICQNLVIIQKESRYKYESDDFLVTPYIDGVNYLELHPELSDEPLQITKNEFLTSLGLEPDTINSSEVAFISPPVKRGSYCIYLEKPFRSLYFKIEKQPKWIRYTGRIQPTYYTLKTEEINVQIQPGELVKVTISVNDSLFSYRIFDNTELKIKDKKLIFKDSEENNKTNKLYLK
ncbi:MAG: hypothetical protein LBI45_02680 [Bacteroidales bacterium]|jgi:hypothetical protein|nr:hypothetical protein [Bacteroidales bacterium]